MWDGTALVPPAVVNETRERNRLRNGITTFAAIDFESQFLLGVSNVRGHRMGAQIHASRHLLLPKCHRLAENSSFNARRLQICRRGKSIWPRPDNGYIAIP